MVECRIRVSPFVIWSGVVVWSSLPPLGDEFALEHPLLVVRVPRFATPMKAVRCDLRKRPAGLRPIRTRTFLKDVLAVPAAHLFLAMSAHRICPRDLPRLHRRVPRAKRRAVHVHRRI